MRASDLLLNRFDEELRHLWGAQLIPRESGFASWHDEEAKGMREIVDR